MVRLSPPVDPPGRDRRDARRQPEPPPRSPTPWAEQPARTTGQLALVLLGGTWGAAVGVAFLIGTADNPYFGVIGLGLLLLGGGGAVTGLLERRWDARRPGPRLSADPSGAPSTLVTSAPWTGALRWTAALALVVPLTLATLLALLGAQWVAAVVLGGLALTLWWLLAPRTAPQGVHLSARGLTVLHHGRPQRADWDDVELVTLTAWVEVRLTGGRRLRFTPRQLAVGPGHLAFALSLCVQDAATRSVLGTTASLDPRWWGGSA